ncbi:hypothetical protein [Nitratireductor rhodophyticola]|nr:hypothetical protein [Nitratireductor rhodophyticola]
MSDNYAGRGRGGDKPGLKIAGRLYFFRDFKPLQDFNELSVRNLFPGMDV